MKQQQKEVIEYNNFVILLFNRLKYTVSTLGTNGVKFGTLKNKYFFRLMVSQDDMATALIVSEEDVGSIASIDLVTAAGKVNPKKDYIIALAEYL